MGLDEVAGLKLRFRPVHAGWSDPRCRRTGGCCKPKRGSGRARVTRSPRTTLIGNRAGSSEFRSSSGYPEFRRRQSDLAAGNQSVLDQPRAERESLSGRFPRPCGRRPRSTNHLTTNRRATPDRPASEAYSICVAIGTAQTLKSFNVTQIECAEHDARSTECRRCAFAPHPRKGALPRDAPAGTEARSTVERIVYRGGFCCPGRHWEPISQFHGRSRILQLPREHHVESQHCLTPPKTNPLDCRHCCLAEGCATHGADHRGRRRPPTTRGSCTAYGATVLSNSIP